MRPVCPGNGGTVLESPCGAQRAGTVPKSWWLPSRARNKASFCGFHRRFNMWPVTKCLGGGGRVWTGTFARAVTSGDGSG